MSPTSGWPRCRERIVESCSEVRRSFRPRHWPRADWGSLPEACRRCGPQGGSEAHRESGAPECPRSFHEASFPLSLWTGWRPVQPRSPLAAGTSWGDHNLTSARNAIGVETNPKFISRMPAVQPKRCVPLPLTHRSPKPGGGSMRTRQRASFCGGWPREITDRF